MQIDNLILLAISILLPILGRIMDRRRDRNKVIGRFYGDPRPQKHSIGYTVAGVCGGIIGAYVACMDVIVSWMTG